MEEERDRRRSCVGSGKVVHFEQEGRFAEDGFALPEAKEETRLGARCLQETARREHMEAKVDGRGCARCDGAVGVGLGAAQLDERQLLRHGRCTRMARGVGPDSRYLAGYVGVGKWQRLRRRYGVSEVVEAFVDPGDAGKEVQDALVGTEGGRDEGVGGKQVDELPAP